MNAIISKAKEVFLSVAPITALVLILHFTITPMDANVIIRFIIGSVFVMIGLIIFLLGVDIGVTPLGSLTGSSLVKSNKLWIVLITGLILGFFVSVAEPGLIVLANQVNLVTSGNISGISIIIVVSIGLAVMLSLGMLRVFYKISLNKVFIAVYSALFILAIFSSREFIAISFDAAASTTGILVVPFILAISVGISKLNKDSEASERDSFGLVAVTATGIAMSVMLLGIFSKTEEFVAALDVELSSTASIIKSFTGIMPQYIKESFIAILPLVIILLVLQKIFFKLRRRELRKLITGFLYAFIGLFIFLVGVNAGFMDVGTTIGSKLALLDNKIYIIVVAFVLGFVTVMAEPAVYILTRQIEDVTSGHVKRKAVLVSLTIGAGSAVALSIIRILVPGIQLWHYLLPGYAMCIIMMFFIPKLFVGMSFDAGVVATGPMTATFILAFVQGAAGALEGADVLIDGFGMIATAALTPIVTLEVLGLIFAIKLRKKGVEKKDA